MIEKIMNRREIWGCSICDKKMRVIFYRNRRYRGGHYFGKIHIHSKKEWKKAIKAGIHKAKMGDMIIDVLNKDPKPYKYFEYWECPRCYWKK